MSESAHRRPSAARNTQCSTGALMHHRRRRSIGLPVRQPSGPPPRDQASGRRLMRWRTLRCPLGVDDHQACRIARRIQAAESSRSAAQRQIRTRDPRCAAARQLDAAAPPMSKERSSCPSSTVAAVSVVVGRWTQLMHMRGREERVSRGAEAGQELRECTAPYCTA